MTMNRKRQRAAILKAAKWIASHPKKWNKEQFFGTNTGRTTSTGGEVRGFDAMGATYPWKYSIFTKPLSNDGNAIVAEWVFKNFPNQVIGDIAELNDKSQSAEEAARRVRGYVGKHYSSN